MFFSKSTIAASVLIASAGLVSASPMAPFSGPIPRSIQQANIFLREQVVANGRNSLVPGMDSLTFMNASTTNGLLAGENPANSAATSLRGTSFPLIIGFASIGGLLVQYL